MAVNPKLRPFLKLQEIESERWQLRKVLEAGETRREEPRRRLRAAKQSFATVEAARLAKEKDLADAQLRLKIAEEQLKKLERQQQGLSSGREYKTMENQIKGKKADMSLIEDEILKLMELADAARKESAAANAALAAATDLCARTDAAVSSAALDSLHRLEELNAMAVEAERACDPELFAQYANMLKRSGAAGIGIAPLLNRICQGCHTSVTPPEENRAMAGQIVTCSNCHRFIYMP